MNKKSMMFYFDWRDILIDSYEGNYEAIGRIVMALLNYGQCGELPVNLSDTEMIAFNFMYAQVDRDIKKYLEKAEKNRQNALKGAEAKRNAVRND